MDARPASVGGRGGRREVNGDERIGAGRGSGGDKRTGGGAWEVGVVVSQMLADFFLHAAAVASNFHSRGEDLLWLATVITMRTCMYTLSTLRPDECM